MCVVMIGSPKTFARGDHILPVSQKESHVEKEMHLEGIVAQI